MKAALFLIGKFTTRICLLAAVLTATGTLRGQRAGDVDLSFNPNSGTDDTFNGAVRILVLQPDQKALVAGDFTIAGGAFRAGIARLLEDGSADPDFDPGVRLTTGGSEWHYIHALLLQPDGKVLVGGSFTHFDGVPRSGMVRLHPDGTLDPSFDPGEAPGPVRMVLQPDGKILVSGSFTEFQGAPRDGAARLNPDGSLDTSFVPVSGIKEFLGVSPGADGRPIALGALTSGAEAVGNSVARLNPDGSLDPAFTMDPAVTGALTNGVHSAALMPDGKILVWGVVTTPYAPPLVYGYNHILRLNADGSLDPTFKASTTTQHAVYWVPPQDIIKYSLLDSVTVQPDGKLLVTGPFTELNDEPCYYFARLNTDGSRDSSFRPATAEGRITGTAVQNDRKILVIGGFTKIDNSPRKGIARLNADGSWDRGYNMERPSFQVSPSDVRPDGKIIGFERVPMGDEVKSRLLRLNADGTLDSSFVSSLDYAWPALVSADGKIVTRGASGGFTDRYTRFMRLNPDGSPDSDYVVTALEMRLNHMALGPGGTTLVSEHYQPPGGPTFYEYPLFRLNSDGTVDTDFVPGRRIEGAIVDLLVQPDGKVVTAELIGNATDGRYRVARLNANATRDLNFTLDPKVSGEIRTMLLQPDGKIILAGLFTNLNGLASANLARLLPNGSLDASFHPEPAISGWIQCALLQPDGKVLAGGVFEPPTGMRQGYVARFNPDGRLDTSFQVGTILDFEKEYGASVGWLGLQPDGSILISGKFTTVDGVPRLDFARLHGADVAQSLTLAAPQFRPDGQFQWTLRGQPGRTYVLQASSDLVSWTDLGPVLAGEGPTVCTDPAAPSSERRFYRARE